MAVTYIATSRFDDASSIQRLGLAILVATAVKVLAEVREIRSDIKRLSDESRPVEILPGYQEVINAAQDLMADPSLETGDVWVFQGRPIRFTAEGEYFKSVCEAVSAGRVEVFHRAAFVGTPEDVSQLYDNIELLSGAVTDSSKVLVYPVLERYNMSFLVYDHERCQIALPNLKVEDHLPRQACGLAIRDVGIASALRQIFGSITEDIQPIVVPKQGDSRAMEEVERRIRELRDTLV